MGEHEVGKGGWRRWREKSRLVFWLQGDISHRKKSLYGV